MTSPLELSIRLSNGTRFNIDWPDADPAALTVMQVKEKIATAQENTAVELQRLIYKGRILDNNKTLSDYGIVHQSTLFLVKSSGANASTNNNSGGATALPARPARSSLSNIRTISSGMSSASPPTATTPLPSSVPNFPANPWSMPPPNMDPQQMQSMLNSPLMQSMLDNPQLMQTMMESQMRSNPAMRQMLESNPHLQHILNDPAVLQQAIRMMRDPSSMQQAMRQQDLAMSQLENMPGGFAALSSMYRDVQQPLEDAVSIGRGDANNATNSNSDANRSSSSEGATGAAMPNPWGAPPAPAASSGGMGSSTPTAGNYLSEMGIDPSLLSSLLGSGGMPGAPNPANANASSSNPAAAAPSSAGLSNPWGGAPGAQVPFPNLTAPSFWPPSAGGPPSLPPDQLNAMMSMLDNPMMQQLMQQAIDSNPEMFRQIIEQQNPMMRPLFESNPAAAQQMVRQMMNPESLRHMLQLQQQLGGAMPTPGFPRTAAAPPAMPLDFSNLLQQMQGTGLSAGAAAPAVHPTVPTNPADRYRTQLRSLYDMGFDDEPRNVQALTVSHGNVNRAVDWLLSSPPSYNRPATAPATSSSQVTAPAATSETPASSHDPRPDDAAAAPPSSPKNDREKKND
jgi:ubiquilin